MNHGGKRTGAGRKRKIDGRVERSEKAVLKFQLREEYYNKMKHKIETFRSRMQIEYPNKEHWKARGILWGYPLEERVEIMFAYRLVYGRPYYAPQITGGLWGCIFPNELCEGTRLTKEQKKLLRYYDNKRKLEYYKNV